jgi:hypothetical protein
MKTYKSATETGGDSNGNLLTTSMHTYRITAKEPTIVRIIGPVDDEQKSLLPWRTGPGPNDFGNWITAAPVFTGGSTRLVTFVAGVKRDNGVNDWEDPNSYPAPVYEFHNRVQRIKAPALIARRDELTKKSDQHPIPPLSKPSVKGIVQAFVYRPDEDKKPKPRGPYVIAFSKTAEKNFIALLREELPGYTGDPYDFMARFKIGDFLNADGGRLFTFKNVKDMTASEDETEDWSAAGGGGRESSKDKYFPEIGCEPGPLRKLPRNPDGRISLAVDGKFFQPWDQCLRIMTYDEQFDLLVNAFSDYPDVLCHCFSDKLDRMPADVLRGAGLSGTRKATPVVAAAPAARPAAAKPAAPAVDADDDDFSAVGAEPAAADEDDLPMGDIPSTAKAKTVSMSEVEAAIKAAAEEAQRSLGALQK